MWNDLIKLFEGRTDRHTHKPTHDLPTNSTCPLLAYGAGN